MPTSSAAVKRDLFLVSALFLFLELVFIRWVPAQVLFLTFFTNTALLASFLGLSLGCLAARRPWNLLPLTVVLLLAVIAAGSGMEWLRLALQDVLDVGSNKASPEVVYFGAEVSVRDVAEFVIPIEVVAGFFFLLIALTMVGLGQVLGRRFAELSSPVEAYCFNIAGSLAGVLAFQLCSSTIPPLGWFSIVAAGLIYFLFRETERARWAIGLACLAPLLLLVPDYLTLGVTRQNFPVEFWSPYYRINYSPSSRTIVVNLLGHQQMVSRNDPFPGYAVPFLVNRDAGQPQFRDILIIGAGSGNDVSRALEWAAPDARIDAVEIDPVIQDIGVRDHPDRPYQDPRVQRHLGDGRNFLRSTAKKYDLIVFALIDSLVLHSSVSNIRLESYLFTAESMADVRDRLKPDGLFVMYNYFRQGWIVSRLAKTVEYEFGSRPLTLTFPHRDRVLADLRSDAFTLMFAGPRAAAIKRAFANGATYRIAAGVALGPSSPNGFQLSEAPSQLRFQPAAVQVPAGLRVAEDVWPFLYLRNPMIPDLSLRGVGVMAAVSLALLWMFGWRTRAEHLTSSNIALLLLGAGFLLLETKAVVHMALVFGSTWIVNTVVFSAILVMILAANVWVVKRNPRNLAPYYAGLLATLILNLVVPLDSFLGLPKLIQAIGAGTLVLSPVLCAGVVFAVMIRSAPKPEQAMAYNAAGAMLGGLSETSSLLIGFDYLIALAGLIYIGAWVLGRQSERGWAPARQASAGV